MTISSVALGGRRGDFRAGPAQRGEPRLCLGTGSGKTLLGKLPLPAASEARHNGGACGCFVFLSRGSVTVRSRTDRLLRRRQVCPPALAFDCNPFRSQHGSCHGNGPCAVRHLHRQHGPVLLPLRALRPRGAVPNGVPCRCTEPRAGQPCGECAPFPSLKRLPISRLGGVCPVDVGQTAAAWFFVS